MKRPTTPEEREAMQSFAAIVCQIIDRDCHVSRSNAQCIRHVITRLREKHATFRAMPKHQRRGLMLACILRQNENARLYRMVMRGV